MQRLLLRALTVSVVPLIGMAAVIAMSGCAAIPAINMATSLMKPAPQPVQEAGAPAPAAQPDIFTSLAQHFGITLPTQPATSIAAATGPAHTAAATQSETANAAE